MEKIKIQCPRQVGQVCHVKDGATFSSLSRTIWGCNNDSPRDSGNRSVVYESIADRGGSRIYRTVPTGHSLVPRRLLTAKKHRTPHISAFVARRSILSIPIGRSSPSSDSSVSPEVISGLETGLGALAHPPVSFILGLKWMKEISRLSKNRKIFVVQYSSCGSRASTLIV